MFSKTVRGGDGKAWRASRSALFIRCVMTQRVHLMVVAYRRAVDEKEEEEEGEKEGEGRRRGVQRVRLYRRIPGTVSYPDTTTDTGAEATAPSRAT